MILTCQAIIYNFLVRENFNMLNLFDISFWEKYDINKDAIIDYLEFIQNIYEQQRHLDFGELHHIVPKSVDKSLEKEKDNLILLSGEEHFIAHELLLECFNGENKAHMYYSYNLMCNTLKRNGYNVSPKDYESFRSEFKKLCKENNSGSKNPNYGKNHKGKINCGKNNPNYGKRYSEEKKEYLSQIKRGDKNVRYGCKHTEETKELIGKNSKGRVWVNNGVSNKFIRPEEIEIYKSLGFIYKGCLIKGKNR